MTSHSEESEYTVDDSDLKILGALIERQTVALLQRLRTEYHFSLSEMLTISTDIGRYVDANVNFGTAKIMGSALREGGFVFNEELPDPIPVYEKKSKDATLDLIKALRNLDMTTNDINAITADMKSLGGEAQFLGRAHGLDMIDRKV